MADDEDNTPGDGKSGKNSGATSDPPDMNALAREYLDLWQQQLAATAGDDTLAKTMSDAVRLMSAGAAQMAAQMSSQAAAMQTGTGADRGSDGAGTAAKTSGTATGTASAGAAHRDDEHILDELPRRIAELEERIAVLERGQQDTGKRPAPRARKRR